MPKLDDYFRIKEAAEYLGILPNTLRNWTAADKIPVLRNPGIASRLLKVGTLVIILKTA